MFPVLLLALPPIEAGLPIASIILMMLETLRYVLFNMFTAKPLILGFLWEASGFDRSPKQEKLLSFCRLLLLSLELMTLTNPLVGRPV